MNASRRSPTREGTAWRWNRNWETYRAKLRELARHEGKFVLIHGDHGVGTFATYEDALRQGYREFGLQPFMVKQVRSMEQVLFVSHVIAPLHASRIRGRGSVDLANGQY